MQLWMGFRMTEPGLVELPRRLFGGCLVMSAADKLLMVGGFDANTGDYAAEIEEFSLRTNTWMESSRVLSKGH